MSGGTWDYKNLCLYDIAGDLNNKSEESENYSEKTRLLFKEISSKTEILAKILHEADYLLAGDTGEDTFRRRVRASIKKLGDSKGIDNEKH